MEDALTRAGIAFADVDYVEAHGTGTELGDSIELRALASVYGRGREPERPLLLGSVKTNIGHAEWASGVASIIKVVMGMQRGVIPAHLHFRDPNPEFDWSRLPIKITSEKVAWPTVPGRPAHAAVNSFGLSGTNAHVVLEEYSAVVDGPSGDGRKIKPTGSPQPVEMPPTRVNEVSSDSDEPLAPRGTRLLPLSGKSRGAIQELARSYLDLAEQIGGWYVRASV